MARNRKNNAALRFLPATKALIICLLLGASSVGYVLQKNKIFELGREIRQREQMLAELKKETTRNVLQLRNLLSPANLDAAIMRQNLDLSLTRQDLILWVTEPTLNNQMPPTNTTPQLMVMGE